MLRWFLISLTMTLGLGGVILLWSFPYIAREAGGLLPLELRTTGYSEAEARLFLQRLSEEGRQFYLTVHHRLDLAYPLSVAITLLLGARLLFSAQFAAVLSLPILMLTSFDFFENKMIAEMLQTAPALVDPVMIAGAEMWTMLKALTAVGLVAVLVVGMLRQLWVKGWSFRGA